MNVVLQLRNSGLGTRLNGSRATRDPGGAASFLLAVSCVPSRKAPGMLTDATEPLPPGATNFPIELHDALVVRRSSVVLVVAPDLGVCFASAGLQSGASQYQAPDSGQFGQTETRLILETVSKGMISLRTHVRERWEGITCGRHHCEDDGCRSHRVSVRLADCET